MKVIKYLAPLLCVVQLAGCGEDDLAEAAYTPPTDYTFDSRTNAALSSSVSNETAITLQIQLQELMAYITSPGLQAIGSANTASDKFNLLFTRGTNEPPVGEIGSTLAISIATDTGFDTLQSHYDDLATDTALEEFVVGGERTLPFYKITDSKIVSDFVGWELIDDIASGNEMPKKLITDWLVKLGEYGADGDVSTTVIETNGLHYDKIIEQLIKGSVLYSKLTQYNLVSDKGLLSQNFEAVNADVVKEQKLAVSTTKQSVEEIDASILDEEKQLETFLDTWQTLDPDADPNLTSYSYNTSDYPYVTQAMDYFSSKTRLVNLNTGKTSLESTLENYKNEVEELKSYTLLAKNWDEAFGYFGAARNYGLRLDSEILAINDVDISGDGKIDLYSEYNFGYAMDAVNRDSESALANTDFSGNIWNAFLLGRHIIQKNYGREAKEFVGYHKDLKEQAGIILENIEKLAAANIIHEINVIITEIDSAYESDETSELMGSFSHNYYKSWSTLKGMALSLQFNDAPIIKKSDLEEIHVLIGSNPIPENNNFLRMKTDLENARTILKTTYYFDQANVEGW